MCWFLPNINMNQPYVHICSLPLERLSHLPAHPTPLGCSKVTSWKNSVLSQVCWESWWPAAPFYVLTWTMYPWWTLHEISVCHFNIWSFSSKMYMTMPLTSNRWYSSQSFLTICSLGYNPQRLLRFLNFGLLLFKLEKIWPFSLKIFFWFFRISFLKYHYTYI